MKTYLFRDPKAVEPQTPLPPERAPPRAAAHDSTRSPSVQSELQGSGKDKARTLLRK